MQSFIFPQLFTLPLNNIKSNANHRSVQEAQEVFAHRTEVFKSIHTLYLLHLKRILSRLAANLTISIEDHRHIDLPV